MPSQNSAGEKEPGDDEADLVAEGVVKRRRTTEGLGSIQGEAACRKIGNEEDAKA